MRNQKIVDFINDYVLGGVLMPSIPTRVRAILFGMSFTAGILADWGAERFLGV